jgi:lipopolysaccharide/colanic/teichoic acid biosynthesis glycosyltransferase
MEAGSLASTAAVTSRSRSVVTEAACRALDILVAGILLLVLAPIFAAIAIAIRLDSAGWVVFRQQRLGRDLRSFTINKFRTMSAGVEEETHRAFVVALINGEEPKQGDEDVPMFKMTADARVTRVGAFLRRSSLDELPQLWNVLRGDMSLVGPRPPIAYEVEHYPSHWFARFAVKPGLTGLWQVSGRSELTLEQMIELDVDYVRRRSLWLNLQILLRTIPVVLFARGAA